MADEVAVEGRPSYGWMWCRGILAALSAPIGALASLLSLGIHSYLSGYWWRSPRYSMERGGWGWQIIDAALALGAGGLFFSRLTWLLVSALARGSGRDLRSGKVSQWDLLFLGVPGMLLAYLIYVANVD